MNVLDLIREIKARLNAVGVTDGDEALDAITAQCGSLADDEAEVVVELLQIQMRELSEKPVETTAEHVVEQLGEIRRRVCVISLDGSGVGPDVSKLARTIELQSLQLERQQRELERLAKESEAQRVQIAQLVQKQSEQSDAQPKNVEGRLRTLGTQVTAVYKMMESVVDQIELMMGQPTQSEQTDDRIEELDKDVAFLTRIVERLALDVQSRSKRPAEPEKPEERIRCANIEDQLQFMRSQVQASGLLQEQ